MELNSPLPRLAALHSRDFRLLWSGQLFSTIGSQMQIIAVNWQVYALLRGTSDTIALAGHEVRLDAAALGLGVLGMVRVLPIILFALAGGVLADTRDRRLMLISSQLGAALCAAALALLTVSGHVGVGMLYLLTALGAAIAAFETPAQQALLPHLIPRAHLVNAVSLNTLSWTVGSITGPALAGVLVGRFSPALVYTANVITYLTFAAAVLAIRHRGLPTAARTTLSWASVKDGLRFSYRSKLIWSTMLLDFFATFFASARTMLPIVAGTILGIGAVGYGLLATAQPLGALLAGATLSLRRQLSRQGVILLLSIAVYGLTTALFGVSHNVALSYLLLALAGAGDAVSTVIRHTIRQTQTPDDLRGRMSSVHMVFAMGGPQLGEMEAGLLAALYGVSFTILTGGLATLALVAWTSWKYPGLRLYRSDAAAGSPHT